MDDGFRFVSGVAQCGNSHERSAQLKCPVMTCTEISRQVNVAFNGQGSALLVFSHLSILPSADQSAVVSAARL